MWPHIVNESKVSSRDILIKAQTQPKQNIGIIRNKFDPELSNPFNRKNSLS